MGQANKPPSSNYASFLTSSSAAGGPKGSVKKVNLGEKMGFNFKSSIASAKANGSMQAVPAKGKKGTSGFSGKNSVHIETSSASSAHNSPAGMRKNAAKATPTSQGRNIKVVMPGTVSGASHIKSTKISILGD